jgi:hypothetical protein
MNGFFGGHGFSRAENGPEEVGFSLCGNSSLHADSIYATSPTHSPKLLHLRPSGSSFLLETLLRFRYGITGVHRKQHVVPQRMRVVIPLSPQLHEHLRVPREP